jgi:hypothetical protein
MGLGILSQMSLVVLIFFPGNITGMGSNQQGVPLLARQT